MANTANGHLDRIVGTLTDDGLGAMNNLGDDRWQITLRPSDYYNLGNTEEIFQIGMWFRDAPNEQLGYGFRNTPLFFNVESDLPFVRIDPPNFTADTEITMTFNARKGNQELVGAEKVYMHSSTGLLDTQQPWDNAWNNVVGNWGQDDGVGEMTPIGDDLWQITLTPRNYYNLPANAYPYWIAAVFRSADGNTKATGSPGLIENGLIHTNLDFFIRNQPATATEELVRNTSRLYPNPTDGYLNLGNFEGTTYFQVFNSSGQQVFARVLNQQKEVDLSHLSAGVYYYKIAAEKQFQSGKIVVY
jgi:hypothetical protein